MAVHKGIRSKSSAQPNPQHAKGVRIAIPDRAKAARSGSPGVGSPEPRHTTTTQPQLANGDGPRDHQKKAELFKTLERLNHGYGTALAALDRLRVKDRLPGKRVFPIECLNDFRGRTEMLRALANRDLLRLLAGHEEWEVERFKGSA